MNLNDAAKLDDAIIFATKAHAGAMRKGGGLPYIVHPMEALSIATSMTDDIDVLCAAVLHDVVEDTKYTLEEIRLAFGQRISDFVAHMSENKRRERPAEETWRIRKEEALRGHMTAPLEVKIIFLSDKLSNLRGSYKDFLKVGDAIWQRFNMKDKAQQEWYYRAVVEVCHELENTPAYLEYVELLDKVFVHE